MRQTRQNTTSTLRGVYVHISTPQTNLGRTQADQLKGCGYFRSQFSQMKSLGIVFFFCRTSNGTQPPLLGGHHWVRFLSSPNAPYFAHFHNVTPMLFESFFRQDRGASAPNSAMGIPPAWDLRWSKTAFMQDLHVYVYCSR